MVTFNIINATGSDDIGETEEDYVELLEEEFLANFSSADDQFSSLADEFLGSDQDDFSDEYFPADEKFFAYFQILPAFISLLCSIFILQHVARTKFFHSNGTTQRTRVRQGNTFPRMLMALCFMDCLSSTMLVLEPLMGLGVQDSVGHWTCTMSGSIKLIGCTCALMYNWFIAIYMYLVVVWNWTDDFCEKWFEPPVHFFILFWIVFWLAGIPLEAYNPLWGESDCWASTYPPVCTSDGADGTRVCIRGDPWGATYGWVVRTGFMICFTTIVATNVRIYCNVRLLLRKSNRYAGSERSASSQFATSSTMSIDSSPMTISENSPPARSKSFEGSIPKRDRTREVAIKSFLYCGGVLLTFMITFIGGVAKVGSDPSHHETWWYPIYKGLQRVTWPMQGFCNFCVYIYPKYVEWRQVQLYRDGTPNRWRTLLDAMSTKPYPDARALRRMKQVHLQSLRSGASSSNLTTPAPLISQSSADIIAPRSSARVFDNSIVDITTDLDIVDDEPPDDPEDNANDDDCVGETEIEDIVTGGNISNPQLSGSSRSLDITNG